MSLGRSIKTFYDQARREPSRRELRDGELNEHIRRVHAANYGVYGARKVWLALNREGIGVARCTVERLMAELGPAGAVQSSPPQDGTRPGTQSVNGGRNFLNIGKCFTFNVAG